MSPFDSVNATRCANHLLPLHLTIPYPCGFLAAPQIQQPLLPGVFLTLSQKPKVYLSVGCTTRSLIGALRRDTPALLSTMLIVRRGSVNTLACVHALVYLRNMKTIKCECGRVHWSADSQRETWAFLHKKPRTTREVADKFGLSIQNAYNRVRILVDAGLARECSQRVHETGGIEKVWVSE